jgi:flagellar biosynthesis component FlhA
MIFTGDAASSNVPGVFISSTAGGIIISHFTHDTNPNSTIHHPTFTHLPIC